MHRIETRTYVGEPGEIVTVTTHVTAGGQAAVIVDGVDMGQQGDFTLPENSGDRVQWQVALMGPLGSTCVVGIGVVDSGSDGDFLICQAHNPAPVHFYTCSVTEAPALRTLRRTRTAKAAASTARRAKPVQRTPAKQKPATRKKPGTKKPGTKKKLGPKKTAGAKTSAQRRATATRRERR